MKPAAPRTTLGCLLLAVTLAASPLLLAQQDVDNVADDTGIDRATERSLLDAIRRLESRDGAYSADLPEQMLSLGLALQQQERHAEAVDIFKRGVHLARINNGLYCLEQIPLLNGEIQSSIALGEYSRVDELQQYLYRVQLRGLDTGKQRAAALLKQAGEKGQTMLSARGVSRALSGIQPSFFWLSKTRLR